MNTDHAAEHARLTEKANEYALKAKQHAKDRQGLFFATMARAKSIQAIWHWKRMFGIPRHTDVLKAMEPRQSWASFTDLESKVVDYREALRDRDTVQQSALPSWVNKSPDERYEQMIHFGEHAFKLIGLALITILCAASIWQNYRRTQPEVDVLRECVNGGGNPRVFRDAKGKVLAVGCSHAQELNL